MRIIVSFFHTIFLHPNVLDALVLPIQLPLLMRLVKGPFPLFSHIRSFRFGRAAPYSVRRRVLNDEISTVYVVILDVNQRGGGVFDTREVDECKSGVLMSMQVDMAH